MKDNVNDYGLVCQFTLKCSRLLNTFAKSQYYHNKIKEYEGSQRTVFGVVNKVLHLNQTVVSKIIKSNNDMGHDFSNFFNQKVKNIHSSFCSMY